MAHAIIYESEIKIVRNLTYDYNALGDNNNILLYRQTRDVPTHTHDA